MTKFCAYFVLWTIVTISEAFAFNIPSSFKNPADDMMTYVSGNAHYGNAFKNFEIDSHINVVMLGDFNLVFPHTQMKQQADTLRRALDHLSTVNTHRHSPKFDYTHEKVCYFYFIILYYCHGFFLTT
jgi:hypothetical protein